MNKRSLIIVAVLLAALVLALPVLATQPTYDDTGTWDNFWSDDESSYYDVHGSFEGTVTQPNKPGRAQKATFVGEVDGRAGECLMNVVTIGKHGVGSGTILQCTGGLQGLQATINIYLDDPANFTGSYETWYHFEP